MSYLKEFPTNRTLELIGRLAMSCSKKGPLSAQLNQLIIDGKYLELIKYKFDYTQNYSREDFLYARQIQGLLSKQDFLDLGVDKEDLAWTTFLDAEKSCSDTNSRFRSGLSGESPDVHAIMFIAQRKISSILGVCPSYHDLDFSFGPGATTSVKRARSNPRVKLEAQMSCSINFVSHVKEFLANFPVWTSSHVKNSNLELSLSHGKLQFVPKSSISLRSICVEPTLNGFGQQGIGRYMKKLLKRSGVDLSDQTRNQRLACKGSISGALATIDLSSASDTIAYNLVMQLLPWDWFDLLDRFRTPTVRYRDRILRLEKFSGMGNSYTFELESLIFYSLAFSCCSYLGLDTSDVSCYGDDIIIPVAATDLLKRIFSVCGFTINTGKSYTSGPFRESCGADYLDGFDIRPFYLKDQGSVRTLFNMHNWFIRHCEFELAELVIEYIPTHMRIFGPDGFGDGHLIGSYQLRSSRKLRRCGFEGGFFDTYVAQGKRLKMPELTDWVYPVYSIYVRESDSEKTDNLSPMSSPKHDTIPGVSFYKKVSIYTLKRSIFSY